MTLRFTSSILIGLALFGFTAPAMTSADSAQDVAALIRRQSQEFSDASASGNVAVLARLLDDNVTFINENGETGTRKDLIAPGPPPPKGISSTLVQADWHCQLYGSVAVTAFTDNSTVRFHGQVLKAKFRSTEVWIEKNAKWKMISSQTVALQDDPPPIALPSDVLGDYVGTYSAGPGYDVRIDRSADDLTASVNGTKPFVLKAEVKDVFFVPGQPRVRRIFQRDQNGTVIGFVSRREGHDIILKREM